MASPANDFMTAPANTTPASSPAAENIPPRPRGGSKLWQAGGFLRRLAMEAPFWLKVRLTCGLPEVLLYFGYSPGDDMLCTAVVHELSKRGRKGIWLMSKSPDLFEGNNQVARVVPADRRYERFARFHGCGFLELEYAAYDRATDRSLPPTRHIIAEMCARAGMQGRIELRPYLHLTAAERESAIWAKGKIAIQSSGMGASLQMANKQWPAERFQQVVDALKDRFEFVQVGAPSDPPLKNVTDVRGKTSRRELAAVLANCQLYIGTVGFLMHVARAVECPSVIVYGGREAPWQTGYGCNTNLYSPEPCAPCWLWNRCDFDHVCMTKITATAVVQAALEKLTQPAAPLAVDVCDL